MRARHFVGASVLADAAHLTLGPTNVLIDRKFGRPVVCDDGVTIAKDLKTERSVRTASSEQVRQPIFREGLLQWRNYQRRLGPLKDSLDDALIRYRE